MNNDNRLIDKSVARVEGAVRVASEAVSTTVTIKNEAVDDVESLKTKSNNLASNVAIKKMKDDTKKGIADNNK